MPYASTAGSVILPATVCDFTIGGDPGQLGNANFHRRGPLGGLLRVAPVRLSAWAPGGSPIGEDPRVQPTGSLILGVVLHRVGLRSRPCRVHPVTRPAGHRMARGPGTERLVVGGFNRSCAPDVRSACSPDLVMHCSSTSPWLCSTGDRLIRHRVSCSTGTNPTRSVRRRNSTQEYRRNVPGWTPRLRPWSRRLRGCGFVFWRRSFGDAVAAVFTAGLFASAASSAR